MCLREKLYIPTIFELNIYKSKKIDKAKRTSCKSILLHETGSNKGRYIKRQDTKANIYFSFRFPISILDRNTKLLMNSKEKLNVGYQNGDRQVPYTVFGINKQQKKAMGCLFN